MQLLLVAFGSPSLEERMVTNIQNKRVRSRGRPSYYIAPKPQRKFRVISADGKHENDGTCKNLNQICFRPIFNLLQYVSSVKIENCRFKDIEML